MINEKKINDICIFLMGVSSIVGGCIILVKKEMFQPKTSFVVNLTENESYIGFVFIFFGFYVLFFQVKSFLKK